MGETSLESFVLNKCRLEEIVGLCLRSGVEFTGAELLPVLSEEKVNTCRKTGEIIRVIMRVWLAVAWRFKGRLR